MAYVYGNNIGDQALAAERERSYFDSRADAEYARNVNSAARDQANAFQFRNLARQDYMDQSTADQLARAEQRQANQDAVAASRARFDMGLISEQSKLAREKFEEDKRYAAVQASEKDDPAVVAQVAASLSAQMAARDALLAKLQLHQSRFNDASAVAGRFQFANSPDGQFKTTERQGTGDEYFNRRLDYINSERNLQSEEMKVLNTKLADQQKRLNDEMRQAARLGYTPTNDGLVTRSGTFYPFTVPGGAATPAAPAQPVPRVAAPATPRYQPGPWDTTPGGARFRPLMPSPAN